MRHAISLMLLVGLGGFPVAVLAADECTTDDDCPEGLICMPSPCPAIACEDPTDCPPCDSVGTCIDPGPSGGSGIGKECTTDPDCPFGFVCQEQEVPCPGAACPPCDCGCRPGEEGCDCQCPECPEPPPCEPMFVKVCVYKPKACSVDEDCGPGFQCVAEEACSGGCACAGCACPSCPEGADCPPCECPDPDPCTCDTEPTCEVTGHHCEPMQIPCAEDAQCPADWTCSPVGGTACLCPDCACPSPDGEGGATDCECGPCECDQESSDQFCLPPGWADLGIVTPGDGSYGQPRTDPTDGEASGGTVQEDGTAAPTTHETGMVPPSKGGCMAASPADAVPLALILLGLAVRRRRP